MGMRLLLSRLWPIARSYKTVASEHHTSPAKLTVSLLSLSLPLFFIIAGVLILIQLFYITLNITLCSVDHISQTMFFRTPQLCTYTVALAACLNAIGPVLLH